MSTVGLNHRYLVRNFAIPAAFVPTDIAGLVAWYDASDAATITSSGGAVSQLSDKSGIGNHLTQGTGAKQPTTGTRTQNGRNVIDFDGGDAIAVTTASYTQPNTIYVVLKMDVASTGQVFDGGTQRNAIYIDKSAPHQWSIYAQNTVASGTNADTNPHIASALFNGASSTLRLDGVQIIAPTNAGPFPLQDFAIMSLFNVGDGDGWIAEALVYNGDVSASHATIESYLNAKWAVY